jgi:hypothetical protein
MHLLKTQRLAFGALLVIVGVTATPALASSSNVVTAIKTQDTLRRLPANKDLNAHLNSITAAQAKKLAPQIGPLVKASDHAIAVVAKSTTSSSHQRQGKALWIKASHEQERGILQYRTALEDLLAGKQAAFKSEHTKALNLIDASVVLSAKADQLLKISVNY